MNQIQENENDTLVKKKNYWEGQKGRIEGNWCYFDNKSRTSNKAIKRYYHLDENRAAKKEFDCIFTETKADITDSSYEDVTPEQDEENKAELCQISLFKDKIVSRNSNHILYDKFALVKSAMDSNWIFESLDLATTGGAIGHKDTRKLIFKFLKSIENYFLIEKALDLMII